MHIEPDVLKRYPPLSAIARRVGNTELVEIPMPAGYARVFAKLEFQNPYGTVKDRVAFAMIYRLLRENNGEVGPVLEYTGGSLGISLASICSELGISLTLVVSHVSETLESFEQQGRCRLERVDPALGFWHVMERARELARLHPEFKFLYQHQNSANLEIHREHTGQEILSQLQEHKIESCDAWIASIGTGGSLIGVYQALSSNFPDVKLVAVSPAELPYGSPSPPNGYPKFAGSGGLGCGRTQPFVEPYENRFHHHFEVAFEEAVAECGTFKKEIGFSIGTSSGANLIAARQVARELGSGKSVVTIFPSAAP